MPNYKMVIFTSPVDGREKEYNDWYQNIHLGEVIAIPGIKSAQRFRLQRSMMPRPASPYLAIYDIETDDIDGVMKELERRALAGQIFISDAMAMDRTLATVYEECGPSVSNQIG
jgi:hypothetical protein